MARVSDEIDKLKKENKMVCACGQTIIPDCTMNDWNIDLEYECFCGREWKIENVKQFCNGDTDMKPHIKRGVKIIFSFKTEYYYLYDGYTLIDKYEVFEDARDYMDVFIRACAYGERKEDIYEYIRGINIGSIDDKTVLEIWNNLTDVPFDTNNDRELILSRDFYHFDKGTKREDIWKWFDEHYSEGISGLLYEEEN